MDYHKHITSKTKLLDLKLGEVWRYRGLAWLFTKRGFQIYYKQTILGPAWLFINPLITSLIRVFVFGVVAGLTYDGVPQFVFQFVSGAIWSYFAFCVTTNSTIFLNNANIFGKVYFPRLIMPISTVITGMLKFGMTMIFGFILVFFYVFTGVLSPNWLCWLLIPVIIIQLGIMGMGLGIIVSSLTTKYRDLSILVTFGVQLWMYASPVVYPLSVFKTKGLPQWAETIVAYNPVTAPLETLRYAIFGVGTVESASVIVSVAFTIVVAFLGIVLFNKVEKTFIDTV